ncbi:DCC1-like thiol-disulfide oxidoreductase family protein [Halohasta litorea]|uniref:DCC1-like thiol-disulfide oxidoreductase family protein n=1 Tax=Halohasta litorea TaxID=869891 RepID=A0ABD6DAI6_9EURY|nr:DCC1-like thiol-disulfide oxidoreductase family protein [Halohasta litorea]
MVPKLVYDDACPFCTWAVLFAVRRGNIRPVRLSAVRSGDSRLTEAERHRLPDAYEACAHLVTDEAVYSCGAAVEQSLVIAGILPEQFVGFLRQFADYERARERLYRLGAEHRGLLSTVVGREPPVNKHLSAEHGHRERHSE